MEGMTGVRHPVARPQPRARGLTDAEVVCVYVTYEHALRRRCRVLLRDDALADDAVQDAFVKVIRYGHTLIDTSSRRRWLNRVVDRCCFDILDRRGRRSEVPMPSEHVGHRAPGPQLEARSLARVCFACLRGRDQHIAVLAFVDGLTQTQIADELGVSRQTVNKRLQHIRARIERAADRGERRERDSTHRHRRSPPS